LQRYRYRIEPTPTQRKMLARVFGCCRVVFNDALRVRDDAYHAGIKLSDSEIQRRVITAAKTTVERGWLGEVPRVALVQSVNDSRRAWRNFFDSRSGKRRGGMVGQPRMKSKKDHRQSFRLTRNGFRVRPNGRLFVAKVGEVRVRWPRDLPAEPSSVTIIREPDGHYYASFVVDVESTPLPAAAREAGVDVGIARLATIADTDGARTDIANPKHSARKLRKLRRLEREKSRRQKGSANRDKTRRKVAIAHHEVARARRDYHHNQALALVRENQVIHVEDLNIVGMVRNRRLARAIGDAGWGHFLRILGEKAERYGRTVHSVSRWPQVEQDVLGLRPSSRRTAVADPHLDVPVVRCGARPRPQRRQGHSHRRAGGEAKRLPPKWAGPRKRLRWSTDKTSLREAWCR
jgi:putative transposase